MAVQAKVAYAQPQDIPQSLDGVELHGAVVTLKPLAPRDMLRVFRWLWEKEVRRYFNPILNADGWQWVITIWTAPATLIYSIWAGDENGKLTHVGNVGIQDIDWRESRAEIGIALGEERFRNQGFGQDALRVFVEHLTVELGLRNVIARILVTNERSRHVFEKLGFRCEGIQKTISTPEGKEKLLLYHYQPIP